MSMKINGHLECINTGDVFVGTEKFQPPTVFQFFGMKKLSNTIGLKSSYNYSAVWDYSNSDQKLSPERSNWVNKIEVELPFGFFQPVNNEWLNSKGYDKAWVSNVIDPVWLMYYSTKEIEFTIKKFIKKTNTNLDKTITTNYRWRQRYEPNSIDEILRKTTIEFGNQIVIGYNSCSDSYEVFWTYVNNEDYEEYIHKRVNRMLECFSNGKEDYNTYLEEEAERKAKEEAKRKAKAEEEARKAARKAELEEKHKKGIYVLKERDAKAVERLKEREKREIANGYNPYTDYGSSTPRWHRYWYNQYFLGDIFDAIEEAGYNVEDIDLPDRGLEDPAFGYY